MRKLFCALLLLLPYALFGATTTPITLTTPESCYSFFAGPGTGTYPTSLGVPSFRRLVTADFTGASVIIPMANGGTGIATTTAYGPICGGTTSTGAWQNAGAGTTGQFLKSNGASALPSWLSVPFTIQSATPFNTIVGTTASVITETNTTLFGYHAGNAIVAGGINNTAVGSTALVANSTGTDNTAIGYQSLFGNTTGTNNSGLGTLTLSNVTTGTFNTGIGAAAGDGITTGDYNTAIGGVSLNGVTTGSRNTAVGTLSLHTNTTTSGNVALGYHAGYYETGSDSFYIDNQDRSNTAGDKAGALLYGTFNADPHLQTLDINGLLNVNNGSTLKINLKGSTSGNCRLSVAAVAGTGTVFQFPPNMGTNNYVLTTNGSGTTSWSAPPGGASLPFRLGTATTADALADTLLATSATTQKALVLQASPVQSANIFEVQDSTGALLFFVDNSGSTHNNTSNGYFGTGSNLTNLSSSSLIGALPALDGSALTGISPSNISDTANLNLAGYTITSNSVNENYVYVNDVSTPSTPGSGGIFYSISGHPSAMGTLGVDTPLAPHMEDGPASLYDDAPGIEEVVRHVSYYTGTIEWINRSRMARKLDGEQVNGKCRMVESFADFNARTGASLKQRDWDKDQIAHAADANAKVLDFAKRKADAEANHKSFKEEAPKPFVKAPKPKFIK